MTVEELAAEREKARAEGRADPLALARPRAAGRREPAVRGAPARRRSRARPWSTTWSRARSRSATSELDDLILLRADGSPTYNLAVVVDDHDMGITHVIRGDDHLSNAARQTLIYQAPGLGPAGASPTCR